MGDILARDSAAEVRIAAARQLARGNSASVPPLLTGLADSDPSVVVAVLEALTLVGDASLLTELRPLLEHPHALVRERAARAVRLLQ